MQIESCLVDCFGGETALDPFIWSSDTLQVALINQIWSWMEYLQVLTSRKVNIAIEIKSSPSNLPAVIFQYFSGAMLSFGGVSQVLTYLLHVGT